MRIQTLLSLVAVLAASSSIQLAGTNANFVPDWTFKGSALTEWQPIGQTDWRAQNGEIIATPKSADGGWLVLNQSFQDVQLAASVRCTGACKPGVLVRAEKMPDGGMKGIYVSYAPGDIAAYALTLDAQGREVSRERLRAGGGQARFVANADGTPPVAAPGRGAPPAAAVAAPARGGPAPGAGGPAGGRGEAAGRGGGRGGGGRGPVGMPAGYADPYTPREFSFKSSDWNAFEVEVDANLLRGWLNNGPEPGVANGAADEENGRYGPVALFAGGEGEIRFKDIELKDLGKRVTPTEVVSPRFKMLRLSNFSYSWSASAADIDRDGVLDVVSGPFYYLGPDFTVSREIFLSQTGSPSNAYTNAMVHYANDWTGDGFPDVLIGQTLYVNPGKELRRWDRVQTGMLAGGEVSAYKDIDGDGKIEVVNSAAAGVSFSRPDPANPLGPWISVNVSGPGPWSAHGVGVGDINGDGRQDIVNPWGWWEQPAGGAAQTPWTYHVAKLGDYMGRGQNGPGGAEMMVYDVNGDKRNDIVTALAAHAWGLAWFEQKRDAAGEISFVRHDIMGDFSTKNAGGVTFAELHGLTAADMDGDGVQDIVTGKRYWSHQESYVDPDPLGAPVLYIFRTVRNPKAPGGAEFVPELVHNRSGAGSTLQTADLNKDGAMDIMTGTKLGTFVFLGTPRAAGRGRGAAAPAQR